MKLFLTCAVGLVLGAGPSQAVEGCKAKISSKDGTVQVSAKNVEGNPTDLVWGGALGEEKNVFSNAADCVSNGKAKNCTFGDPGSRLANTPPASCRVFLADGGMATCSVYIKGCTPGTRPMWAAVSLDGMVERGVGVVGASRPLPGAYNVLFDQDLTGCSYVATLADPFDGGSGPGEIDAAGLLGNPTGIFLRTHDSTGTSSNYDFQLMLTCP